MTSKNSNGRTLKHSPVPVHAAPTIREPLAIIGIGCRFPGGANDPVSFWTMLTEGVNAISEVPDDRWNKKAFYDPEMGKPGKSHARWGGFVKDIDRFDAAFFGISPREAARMDPQQRLLLETAWESLEDGGQVLERLQGSDTAVFVGISSWEYSFSQICFRDRAVLDTYSNTGGSLSIAANRISYCFDFKGPSVAVDTACSSALVAVHLACKSIWEEGCSLALAGGVNALLLPDWYVGFSRLGMLSPDGRCHAFDAHANGFVRGEGAGFVVLKPLSRALAEGDRVYAVVHGSAVNQDGRTPGLTVPSAEAQEALLRQAYRNAGIEPADVHYVEAHGTGTLVGDPIEARALGNVLSVDRAAGSPCLLGSVKTNVGHLEAGSGIAGLIKTALALYHRRIPGNLHFQNPNPAIDFAGWRLRVPVRSEPWPAGTTPATAGVNSFGYGGTNAHVVLRENPQRFAVTNQPETPAKAALPNASDWSSPVLLPLSARSPQALRALANAWHDFLQRSRADVSLRELASNAVHRRSHHDFRAGFVAQTREDLGRQLTEYVAATEETLFRAAKTRPHLAFVCSGQGPQWWAMGRQLLENAPVYQEVLERCDALIRQLGSWSLLTELTADEAHSRMAVTAISQPALFALQIALAALWRSWGVRPVALLGHSVGEVAAAYLAGVFSLEDAVRIIYQRGRCMELASARGRMLAAGIDADEARHLIAPFGDRVSLAAVNSPASVTLSGEAEPLEAIAQKLENQGVFWRFLQVHYAFHSAQMDCIRTELLAALHDIQPRSATLPLISTVNGKRIDGKEMDAEYWWRNVRQTVRFAEAVDCLVTENCDNVVELGPHPVLASSIFECSQRLGRKVRVLPSLRRREDERATMLRSAGQLYERGYPLDWSVLAPRTTRFLRLPLYPWQRERFWSESEESRQTRLAAPVHPLMGTSMPSPIPSWDARLDPRLLPYLNEHRVQDAVVFPATAYVEMGFAVARERFGEGTYQLVDVKMTNPCFLSADHPRMLHSTFLAEDAVLSIHSRALDSEESWTTHARLVLRTLSQDPPPIVDPLPAIRSRCTKPFASPECYGFFRALGLNYGPLFQGIQHGWRGESEALTEILLPDSLDTEEYLFHPALLDACFQSVLPANPDFAGQGKSLYLPVEIERIRLYRRPGRRLWCHARLSEITDKTCIADLDIRDESGERVAQIEGLRSQRIGGSARESLDDLLYSYEWHPQNQSEETRRSGGKWLIFADSGGIGVRIAERLRAIGGQCTLVFGGSEFKKQDGENYELDPARAEDVTSLVRVFLAEDVKTVAGILHVWNLDIPSEESLPTSSLESAQNSGLLSVLHLVQAWEEYGPGDASLVLVTRGAQFVDDKPSRVAVAQSPILGLGRVIANECPRLRCKLVDLDPAAAADKDLEALFDEATLMDEEDEIAVRDGRRYAHRFVPSTGLLKGTVRADEAYRLTLERPGCLDDLTPRSVSRRVVQTDEIEIEVVSAGLNFSDVMKALGIYPGVGDGPLPLGAECAGRITSVGANVSEWQVGDEVVAVAPFAFGSHVVTRAALAACKPARLSFDEAATLPIAFLTASYALNQLAHLEAGERVLIHAATGGVGLAAIQLARRVGAEIFATAGTPEKRAYLRERGIDRVMDSRSLAFADEIREYTGGLGVDVVLNSLAGEGLVRSVESLGDYGRFLEIGKRDVYGNSRLGLRPFRKNLSFYAIDLDRIIRERPVLLGKLLRQIVTDVDEGLLRPLPSQVFSFAEATAAFRFMQQSKHVGKIVLSMREPPNRVAASEEPIVFRNDSTYLITGGLGGFGLAAAGWMVERGARHLALVGRHGADSPKAKRAVEDLERRGADAVVYRADVADEEQLSTVFNGIDRSGFPLRGVLHAAMVLEDALLRNLDDVRMRRVLAPKVSGAWNLHRLTLQRELDFFVLFSSLSSVFGHAGQGNYAAANAFLDALAWHRRALGLPALTINWGYLGDVGYLAERPQLGERLERQGVRSFTGSQALELLERSMRRRAIQVSVMRVDWSRWRGLGVTGRVSPRFAALVHEREKVERPEGGRGFPTGEAVRKALPEMRGALLDKLLRDKLARVLGTSPERLEGDKPLLNLGVDSLMAVELRNWIEQELRLNVPIMELMRSPGLSLLTDRLAELLADDAPETCAKPRENGFVAEELLTKIDDLPSEDVDALLTSLLADKHRDRSATT